MEIDVADLTHMDEDEENALSWLHGIGARFQGKGPFSECLFERLKILLHSWYGAFDKGDKEAQR